MTSKNIKIFLLNAALSIAGLCFPAAVHGQFLGYTSPQTVAVNVFSAQTTPTTVVVPNLGQNVHSLTYSGSGGCTTLDIRLDGSIDGTVFFPISSDATDSPTNPIGGLQFAGGVTAAGYFPVVRVNLVSIAGCTLKATYAGTSTVTPPAAQIYQQAAPGRVIITQNTVTSAAFNTITVATPFGSSQGSIWLQCSAPCASGGVITVSAAPGDGGLGSKQILSTTIAQVSTLQRFDIIGYPTNRVFVLITPTAASANTWTIYYNFAGQPQPSPGVPITNGNAITSAGGIPFGALACENYFPISTTTNVQFLTGGAGVKFHICSFQIVVSAADNVALVEGTGTTCGTGTTGVFGGNTAATGWNLAANGQVSIGSGLGQIGQTSAAGDSLCLLVSSAAQVSGGFTWTQF